jgi:ABC-type bacteriocin/lantibiotic exporter with double-glycine peptidase domain
MRERPLLLVLDEPTAALDAETEHALFERLRGGGAGTEGLTILVSHRFIYRAHGRSSSSVPRRRARGPGRQPTRN